MFPALSGLLKVYFRAVRTGSWLGWLFNFVLGCVLLAFPPAGRALLLAAAFVLATSTSVYRLRLR